MTGRSPTDNRIMVSTRHIRRPGRRPVAPARPQSSGWSCDQTRNITSPIPRCCRDTTRGRFAGGEVATSSRCSCHFGSRIVNTKPAASSGTTYADSSLNRRWSIDVDDRLGGQVRHTRRSDVLQREDAITQKHAGCVRQLDRTALARKGRHRRHRSGSRAAVRRPKRHRRDQNRRVV